MKMQDFRAKGLKQNCFSPIWNVPMVFLIDVDAAKKNGLTLMTKIKANGIFGGKNIFAVHVPINELVDKYGASKDLMHARCYVWTTQAGKCKAVLDFTFKFGDTVVPAPGSSVASPPPGRYLLLVMQLEMKTSTWKKIAKKLGACVWGLVKVAPAIIGIVLDLVM